MKPARISGSFAVRVYDKEILGMLLHQLLTVGMVTTADHGPCVSGAHNTIVAARAGKDPMHGDGTVTEVWKKYRGRTKTHSQRFLCNVVLN